MRHASLFKSDLQGSLAKRPEPTHYNIKQGLPSTGKILSFQRAEGKRAWHFSLAILFCLPGAKSIALIVACQVESLLFISFHFLLTRSSFGNRSFHAHSWP